MLEKLAGASVIQHVLLIALLLYPAAAAAQTGSSPSSEVLTRDEAVRLAVENNRMVMNAQRDILKAEDDVAAARSRRLPAVDVMTLQGSLLAPVNFEFKAGAFGTFASTGPVPFEDTRLASRPRYSSIFVLKAIQPLSQLHRIGMGIRQLELERDVARERLRGQEESVTKNVRQLYYQVLQAESAIEARLEALKLYRELDRLVSQYVAQQTALRADSLDVKAKLAHEEHELLVLRNTRASLKEQINVVLGRDITQEFSVAPTADAAVFDVNLSEAQARAVSQRHEVREAALRAQQAEYDVRVKKSEAIPDISLAVQYVGLYNFNTVPPHTAVAGVTLTYDIFDGGRRKHELAAKRRTLEQANTGVREAQELVRAEVSYQFRKVQEALGALKVARLSQDAAQEKLRVSLDRYRLQSTLLRETLEGQGELARANNDFQQVVLSFWMAKAEFDKALGDR